MLHIIILGSVLVYLMYLLYKKTRRMGYISDLPNNIDNFSFYGIVTSVGDGDGFRIFHVPCLRSSHYDKNSLKLKVRLAGIDAPEVRCYNKPAQEFAEESKNYLKSLILKKKVKVEVVGIDMYNRILGFVFVKTGFLKWTNVNLKMVEAGMATMYCESNAMYGKYKKHIYQFYQKAKKNKRGIWSNESFVTPAEYKKLYK